MIPPNDGDKVRFNLNGTYLPAIVQTPWRGDIPMVMAKFGMSEEEVIAMHGMRATVEVDHNGVAFTVKNAEYDEDGQRYGTWSYYPAPFATAPDSGILPIDSPPAADTVPGSDGGTGEPANDPAVVQEPTPQV